MAAENVDPNLYDHGYFARTDGADYFATAQTAPKFLHALKISGLAGNQRALDVGCGRGDLLLALARHGLNAVGIDYSAAALAITRKTIEGQPGGIQSKLKVLSADAANLGLAAETFDGIFLMDVVEHLYPGQLSACLAECRRILKKNGALVIHTSPNRWYNDWGYPCWEQPLNKILNRLFQQNLLARPIRNETDLRVHINEQTVYSLKKYLKEAGFHFKIWLGNEYVTPVKKESAIPQLLEICRQIVCHAFPFSLFPPLNLVFSNNIWAIARKTA